MKPDQTLVTDIMTRRCNYAGRDVDAKEVGDRMLREWIGCIPVVGAATRPIGMVTKLDYVEKLCANEPKIAHEASAIPRKVEELMMPFAISLRDTATIAQAAALMAAEDIHHLPICDANGSLVGIVSTMDIVRWVAKSHRRDVA